MNTVQFKNALNVYTGCICCPPSKTNLCAPANGVDNGVMQKIEARLRHLPFRCTSHFQKKKKKVCFHCFSVTFFPPAIAFFYSAANKINPFHCVTPAVGNETWRSRTTWSCHAEKTIDYLLARWYWMSRLRMITMDVPLRIRTEHPLTESHPMTLPSPIPLWKMWSARKSDITISFTRICLIV